MVCWVLYNENRYHLLKICFLLSVCDDFCSICNGPTECLDCVEGYMLTNGTCHMCPEFCSLCTLDGNCTDCVAGYYLDNNQCNGR